MKTKAPRNSTFPSAVLALPALRMPRLALVTAAILSTLIAPSRATAAPFTITDLGTFGGTHSLGWGVNAAGNVVGESWTTGNAAAHAFLYTGSGMVDLNSLAVAAAGWTLFSARGINDAGQITGYGTYDPDGPGGAPAATHAFLLTPAPEPSTIVLAGLGRAGALVFGPTPK